MNWQLEAESYVIYCFVLCGAIVLPGTLAHKFINDKTSEMATVDGVGPLNDDCFACLHLDLH